MSEIEMIGMFSKKTVLLKILYHSTKPFNDLHFFWFRFVLNVIYFEGKDKKLYVFVTLKIYNSKK